MTRQNAPRLTWLAALATLLLAGAAWATDQDEDGLTAELESLLGTSDNDTDSDDDGLSDPEEVWLTGSIPTLADSDGDSYPDGSDPSGPLTLPTGDLDGGNSPAFGGNPTSDPYAYSGETPMDGVGVTLNDGALHWSATVAQSRGVYPFAFTVVYSSRSNYDGYVGKGWFSPLDMKLTTNGSTTTILTDWGIERTWTWSGTVWEPPADELQHTLTEIETGIFKLTSIHGVETLFTSAGRLDLVTDRYDNVLLDVAYTSGSATSIVDSRGESASLAYYSGTGRLKSVTAADGAVWYFRYNVRGQLMRIEGPSTARFPNGRKWEWRYLNSESSTFLKSNMIAAINPNGDAWMKARYDVYDRITDQTVGPTESFVFDYTDSANSKTTVTDRVGNERVWEWHATKKTRKSLVEKTNRGVRANEGDYTTAWTHDDEGYLETVTYPEGNGVKTLRNGVKLVVTERHKPDMGEADSDTSDLVHTWTYDSSKYYGVLTYTDPRGEQTQYTLNDEGRATTVTFPELSGPVTVTNAYTYDETTGQVLTFTDGEGKVTKYEYWADAQRPKLDGLLKKKTVDYSTGSSLNLISEFDYTDWGDLEEVKDPRTYVTSYTVERYGNVTKELSPTALGYETQYEHDGNLDVVVKKVKNVDYDGTALTTPAWWVTTYSYTMLGKASSISEMVDTTPGNNRSTSLTYDANDNLATVSRGGVTVEMSYDERDLLHQRVRDPGTPPTYVNATETFTYDGNRNLTEFKNARLKTTTYAYDDFDRRTNTTNALTDYEELYYDKAGNLTERKFYDDLTTDDLMAHHKRTYDDMGRLWKEEDLLEGETNVWYARTYTLDKRGLVTKVTDRRSQDTTLAYDGAGRRLSATDALGNLTEWTYDANGNVTKVKETEKIPGSGSTEAFETTFTYDEINRQKTQKVIDRTDSQNWKLTEWKRDSLSVVRKLVDPRSNEVTYTHDGLGRITQESRDMGSSAAVVTQWTFDANDHVTNLRDDNSSDTAYTYDALGRLATKTYEDAETVEYEYDANSNLVQVTDQNGTIVDQGFDDLDRLVGRDVTLGTGVGGDTAEDFVYDALSRLTEAKDDDSIVQFTYDSLSRVLTEVQGANPLGTTGKTVTYTWNAESALTKIDYPSGFDANHTRDVINRLTEIKDANTARVAAFDLYGAGYRRKKVSFGNSTTTDVAYDGFRRPTAIDHKTSTPTEFAGFDYGWDKNDNPLYEERSHQSGAGDVYTYDKANRLSKVLQDCADPSAEVATPGSQSYGNKLEYDMDDVFNLTAYKVTPYQGNTTTTSYTTNAMNEYTAVGGTTHAYHDNGSLKDDNTYLYTYDAHDHLIEVKLKSDNSTVATYKYDAYGRGRRTKKIVGSDTTRFVYADLDSIEEYDGSGDLLRLFAFGDQIDQVVMMEAPDQADVDGDSNTSEVLRFHFHTQLIGSVTHVTGPGQSVVESYLYDPYGKPTIKDQGGSTVSASAIGNPYLFTGRQLDEETGLYYYRTRHYSPEIKRFVQRDSREYVDGPNALAYIRARPTAGRDPLGLQGEDTDPNAHSDGEQGFVEATTPTSDDAVAWTWWWIRGPGGGNEGGHWRRDFATKVVPPDAMDDLPTDVILSYQIMVLRGLVAQLAAMQGQAAELTAKINEAGNNVMAASKKLEHSSAFKKGWTPDDYIDRDWAGKPGSSKPPKDSPNVNQWTAEWYSARDWYEFLGDQSATFEIDWGDTMHAYKVALKEVDRLESGR